MQYHGDVEKTLKRMSSLYKYVEKYFQIAIFIQILYLFYINYI